MSQFSTRKFLKSFTQHFHQKSRAYYKAEVLKSFLKNCKKDEYSTRLGKLAVENIYIPKSGYNDNDETLTKKARVEDKNQETIDYGNNVQHESQSSAEDNLAKEVNREINRLFTKTRRLILKRKIFRNFT
uniref:Uncharacterized protein n=1 Tax=Rhizophagus irregularis (strain DAOM 181602 / DAOM 197198 / MUCL 43194) TaxID=747089 RepID=U9SWJ0_RHIID